MEKNEYQNIFNNEDGHFFYTSTHALVLQVLSRHLVPLAKVLDAGCGTGLLLKKLKHRGYMAQGIDANPEAIKYCRLRRVPAQLALIDRLPFPSNTFAAVVCIDVIYHRMVKNDLLALKELWRVTQPGGMLVLRVPAHPWLRSPHDQVVHGRRRYTRTQLQRKLTAAKWQVRQLTFVHLALLPPAFLKSLVSPKVSAISALPSWLNLLTAALLNLENQLILHGLNLPQGVGLFAVCQKPFIDKYKPLPHHFLQ